MKYDIDSLVFIPADKLKGQIVRNGKVYGVQTVVGPSYYRVVERNDSQQVLLTKVDELGNELVDNTQTQYWVYERSIPTM